MKQKTIALALVLVMAFGATMGGTFAYLTSQDSVTNTFTVGNVQINLDESETDEQGVAKKDAQDNVIRTEKGNEYKLFPGGTYTKDPTITVGAESEDAYLVAKIAVNDVDVKNTKLWVGDKDSGYAGLVGFVTGGITSATALTETTIEKTIDDEQITIEGWQGTGYFVTQEVTDNGIVFTYYIEAAKEKKDTVVLFDAINIPGDWTNDDIAKFKDMEIVVTAYAVQADGFSDVYTAYHSAF